MKDKCREIQEKIAEMIASDLPAADTKAIEQHVMECACCREYQMALQEDDRLLTDFVESMDDAVSRLEGRVLERIGVEEKAGARGTSAAGEIAGTEGSDRVAQTDRTVEVLGRERSAATGEIAGAELVTDVKDLTRQRKGIFQSWYVRFAFAAAAVLLLALWVGRLNQDGRGGVAWAVVIARVEQARDYVCRVTKETNDELDLDMVEYHSAEHGVRQDIYKQGELALVQYVVPSRKMIYSLLHRDKTYALIELSDERMAEIESMSDAQEIIKRFRSYDFKEIGSRRINGVRASGIEVRDPEVWAGEFEDGVMQLWVDEETNWPVRLEYEGIADEGALRVKYVLDDFQWNPVLSAREFEFEIPDDYTLVGSFEYVEADEGTAIEGLRMYARFMNGRFPSSLALATAMAEAEDEIERQRRANRFGREEFEDFMKIQSACEFYAELLKEEADVVYYGGSIERRDFDAVLLRWRVSDGEYRVVYGDLRAETVSAERLAELEKKD